MKGLKENLDALANELTEFSSNNNNNVQLEPSLAEIVRLRSITEGKTKLYMWVL